MVFHAPRRSHGGGQDHGLPRFCLFLLGAWRLGFGALLRSGSVAPQFLSGKTERILDFGYCLLRMNFGADNS